METKIYIKLKRKSIYKEWTKGELSMREGYFLFERLWKNQVEKREMKLSKWIEKISLRRFYSIIMYIILETKDVWILEEDFILIFSKLLLHRIFRILKEEEKISESELKEMYVTNEEKQLVFAVMKRLLLKYVEEKQVISVKKEDLIKEEKI